MTLLVTAQVQDLLTRERTLLADLQAFLELQGAPSAATEQARQSVRNLDEAFLLVVVGEFNAGKSSFINALLGDQVLPEGVTPTTDRIYVLLHGEKRDGLEGQMEATSDPFVSRLRVPLSVLEGVALVDTPGTNAIIRQHQALTEGFLPRADLVLFLTSADRPFTESERQFLELVKRWGRSVIMVVNKADLLETAEAREQVRTFVESGARATLGLTPPIFLVSARAEQRGGDAGFAALREVLKMRLSETERTRLKLASPLGVAAELLGAENVRAAEARVALKTDLSTLTRLEEQRERHHGSMQAELDGQLNRMNRLLGEFEVRADKFIDKTLRIGNVRQLVNARELEATFKREAVADLPEAIEKQFGSMIDRFVESNLHFWEDVQADLTRRQIEQPSETGQNLNRPRFSYDRAALVEGISGSAQRHLAEGTQEALMRQLSQDAEDAMKGVIGFGAGGVAIGTVTALALGGALADFTGVLAFLTVGSLGLFVLPQKRLAALRQLRTRLAALRESLDSIVRREYEREQERADARLSDATLPFTQFTQQEQSRLTRAEQRSGELQARLEQLKNEVQQLPI
ncbi:GTP-binding protein [Deinococcus psychrotolerans]|uniref:GTP-binding protein n=1 Tax=Deinococcus psychrotolerans TaxID=2489213 RepID=A0A3G8YCQ6_9DEIO|nr:dynamin family protein [Deinococcus psychrotolerans]AZI43108.1 GTP-binding protein [Deinococcus psychrotolerans]